MQEYLAEKGCAHVTVYVSGDTVRHRMPCFPMKQILVAEGITGFAFYRQKDIAMAEDCDAAILLWDGRTKGTRCNMEDMQRLRNSYTAIRI